MFHKLALRILIVCTTILLFWVTIQSPTWFVEKIVGVTDWIFQDKYGPPPTLDLGAALIYSVIFLACIIGALYIDEFIGSWISKRESRKSPE